MIKNYFRILKKPHAYLQTILNTSVKFQKDRTETVGGVKGTKYLLKTRNHAPRTTHHAPRATHHAPRTTHHAPRATHHAPRTTHHAPRKTKNSVPPLFFEKAGDKKNVPSDRSPSEDSDQTAHSVMQAGLCLHYAHISEGTFSYVMAQISKNNECQSAPCLV